MHHNRLHRLSALESNWKRCSILIFSESSVCLIHPLPRAGWKMFELVVLGLDSALCHPGVNLGRKLWRPWKLLWCKEEQKPTPSTEEMHWCVSVAGFEENHFCHCRFPVIWWDGHCASMLWCERWGFIAQNSERKDDFVVRKSDWDLYNLCLIPNPAVDCCSALG